MKTTIRVLVADDSALMRNLISRLLGRAPDILVAATARDGEDAVEKAIELKPDVVTMDINMPKLDGISAMQMILAKKICPVIMLSSLTQQGAVETFECLELGAFDFVAKPDGTVSAKLDSIADELISKVRAAAASGGLARLRPQARGIDASTAVMAALGAPRESATERNAGHCHWHLHRRSDHHQHPSPRLARRPPSRDFSGATHAGGIHPDLRLPAAERVCHRSGRSRNRGIGACRMLLCGEQQSSSLSLSQTEWRGRAAPAQPAEDAVRAGGGVMMDSVLSIYGARTIGVLMTGIGDDGADQMVRIREAGGVTIAESEESCVVFGMPYQAIARGGAEIVLPSWEMAARLVRILGATTAGDCRAPASDRASLATSARSGARS